MSRVRIAADVGGTFTDVLAVDEMGGYVALKLPSPRGAYEVAIAEGSARATGQLGVPAASVARLLHATTVATNAILERSGPLTGLVTTAGFRDVLEIGRLRIPNSYDLGWSKPAALVRRRHRLEVAERTSAQGEVLAAPDLEALAPAVDAAVAEGVLAFAVSLLNSYANPANEELVAAWLAARHPRLALTTGVAIFREAGEFERTSTAVVDAYLKPVMEGYLDRLSAALAERDIRAPILVMQSSGGMLPASMAREHPVYVLESGPAAGAIAAARVARELGLREVVAFDMGGTTAKACLVENGELGHGSEFNVGGEISAMSRLLRGGGYTIRLGAVDLAEVGAGGGSLAGVDAAGGLQVGPASAGADPGPACYGRGGTRATVTDANLLLGLVSADGLRRAGVEVQPELAAAAVERDVGVPLGLSVEDAAEAVHRVADQQMARALRSVTTERGRDITAHVLVAFGGSGPVHAASLAEAVGIRTVVVPPLAGVLSAVGLLGSALELGLVEPVGRPLMADQMAALEATFEAMEARLRERLPAASVRRTLDLAFAGQAYDLPVEAPAPLAGPKALEESFRSRHLALYGHAAGVLVDVVRARVVATAAGGEAGLERPLAPESNGAGRRRARFSAAGIAMPVMVRTQLARARRGPFCVDDADTTTVVPPGWMAKVDRWGNLVLSR